MRSKSTCRYHLLGLFALLPGCGVPSAPDVAAQHTVRAATVRLARAANTVAHAPAFDWSQFPDGEQCGKAIMDYYWNVHGARVCFQNGCPNADSFWTHNTPDPSLFNRHVWSEFFNGDIQLLAEDILVFPATSGNSDGHASLVDQIDQDGVVWLMDDNWWGGEIKASCPLNLCGHPHDFGAGYPPSYSGWAPYGFYRLKAKDGPGDCGCYNGDGIYCGVGTNAYAAHSGCIIPGLDNNSLYACQNGFWTLDQVCGAAGCGINPNGADYCNSNAPACGCYAGNGIYCGASVNSYAANHGCTVPSISHSALYDCENGSWNFSQSCANGCSWNPNGADYCN
jgi:hypothetical protein